MRKEPIVLTLKGRADLERFSGTGEHAVKPVTRAKIILALDTSGGRTAERQEAIAERLGVSRRTVNNAKRDFLAKKDIAQFLQRGRRRRCRHRQRENWKPAS